jgi:hypothetical protein
LNGFKTATAVLEHQKANPQQCLQQSNLDPDEIDDDSWAKLKDGASRKGFNQLAPDEQTDIDNWVLQNLDSDQPQQYEERKWDLRKWNLTWRILLPNQKVPESPCRSFYLPSICICC